MAQVLQKYVTMNVTSGTNSNIGDEAAQSNDGVEAHADFLFNFAMSQVGDMDVAEDLVQETFLAALGSKSSFSGKSSQRTWLVGILRHKSSTISATTTGSVRCCLIRCGQTIKFHGKNPRFGCTT